LPPGNPSLELSEDEEEEGSGGNKRPKDLEKPPQGDYVLVRQLGPNYPAGSRGGSSDDSGRGFPGCQRLHTTGCRRSHLPGHNANQTTKDIAVENHGGFEMIDAPSEDMEQESSQGQSKVNGVKDQS
jgi:hypothetical protein